MEVFLTQKTYSQMICRSSPRTWRCFSAIISGVTIPLVFSTHVEVFPTSSHTRTRWRRLLHARGGVSRAGVLEICARVSSPRTWRCFQMENPKRGESGVFSTHVEVFLVPDLSLYYPPGLLHARGGVSGLIKTKGGEPVSSPRTWRCFFFKRS